MHLVQTRPGFRRRLAVADTHARRRAPVGVPANKLGLYRIDASLCDDLVLAAQHKDLPSLACGLCRDPAHSFLARCCQVLTAPFEQVVAQRVLEFPAVVLHDFPGCPHVVAVDRVERLRPAMCIAKSVPELMP